MKKLGDFSWKIMMSITRKPNYIRKHSTYHHSSGRPRSSGDLGDIIEILFLKADARQNNAGRH